jgi:hypothetical protein
VTVSREILVSTSHLLNSGVSNVYSVKTLIFAILEEKQEVNIYFSTKIFAIPAERGGSKRGKRSITLDVPWNVEHD